MLFPHWRISSQASRYARNYYKNTKVIQAANFDMMHEVNQFIPVSSNKVKRDPEGSNNVMKFQVSSNGLIDLPVSSNGAIKVPFVVIEQ